MTDNMKILEPVSKCIKRRLCKKYTNTGKMNESKETHSKLVITGSDPAKFLQFQEERLYQVSLLVQAPIHIPRVRIVGLRRDAEISAMIGNILPQFPFSIGLVGQNSHSRPQANGFQHFLRDLHVMYVPGGKLHMDWIAQGVNNSVDLGASAASADADALTFLILLAGVFIRLLARNLPLSRHPRLPCVP